MTEIKIPEFDLSKDEYEIYELLRDDKGEHFNDIVKKWCKVNNKDISPLIKDYIFNKLKSILEKGYCYQPRPEYYKT